VQAEHQAAEFVCTLTAPTGCPAGEYEVNVRGKHTNGHGKEEKVKVRVVTRAELLRARQTVLDGLTTTTEGRLVKVSVKSVDGIGDPNNGYGVGKLHWIDGTGKEGEPLPLKLNPHERDRVEVPVRDDPRFTLQRITGKMYYYGIVVPFETKLGE